MYNRDSKISSTLRPYSSWFKTVTTFGLVTAAFIAARAMGAVSALTSWWRQDFSHGALQSQTCEPTMQLISSEFKVNSYSDGDQTVPKAASLTDGKFVVAWTSDGQDGSNYGVYGQIYNENGTCYGSEFQVNTDTYSQQMLPAVTGLTNGKFVIVWSGYSNYSYTTFGRIYDADGTVYSSEFQLNLSLVDVFPSIASLVDGKFVIVSGVKHTQLFNANGTLHGSEFQATDRTPGNTFAVTGLTDGKLVLIWNLELEFDIYGKIYHSNGTNCTPEIKIATNLVSLAFGSIAVTGLTNGNFVVVWVSSDGDGHGIVARMYNGDGVPYGSQFQINTYTINTQTIPAIATLNDGKFIAVWMSNNQDSDGPGLFGQMYIATGLPYGLEFQVNSHTTNSQSYPSVISLNNSKFAIVWGGYWSADNYNEISGKISMRSSFPILIENSLLVSSRETITFINSANIHATSEGVTNDQIIFIPSNVNNGFFNSHNFTQDDINKNIVFFTHTGSMAPSYCLSVSDGNWLIGPYQARVTYANPNPVFLIAGISSGVIGALVISGYGFFGYRRGYHESRKKLIRIGQVKEKFANQIALQLLGTFDQVGTEEIEKLITDLEIFIKALNNEVNIDLEIKKGGFRVKTLAKITADLLKPYLITERGCCKTVYSFFGRKVKGLKIDAAIERIKEHAESIRQESHMQTQSDDQNENVDMQPIIEI